ncbi:hypothetical protein GCM10027408_20380 [Microbacterium tumbae]
MSTPNPKEVPRERPAWAATSFAVANLDDAVRRSLARLDARRATPTQVRDALASSGVHVSLSWANEWLEDRRARR